MEDANPYRAPGSIEPEASKPPTAERRQLLRLLAAWTVVCLLNMPLPAFFGWASASERGRAGMVAGAAALLFLGGSICVAWRKYGWALVIGGVPIGLSQFLPILHVMAGLVAMAIGEWLGQVEVSDAAVMQIRSETGGFVVTIITGMLLMAGAMLAGLFIRAVAPSRWRKEAPCDSA